jgi:hypothetical protein
MPAAVSVALHRDVWMPRALRSAGAAASSTEEFVSCIDHLRVITKSNALDIIEAND